MTKYDEIKNFWDQAGKSELDNQGLKPTARDPYLQFLIEKNISFYQNITDNKFKNLQTNI